MGYRPELYLVKDAKIIPVAESNNFLPLFWCAIFNSQPYTISCPDRVAHPTLTINQPIKTMPDYLKTKSVMTDRWQRFIQIINGYIEQGFALELYFNDFLLSEVDEEERITKENLETYCRKALNESIRRLQEQSDFKNHLYHLTGFLHLPKHNQSDFNRFNEENDVFHLVTAKSVAQKKPFRQYKAFIAALLNFTVCLCFGVSGIWFALFEGHWLIGLISFFFFGLFGSIFFYAKLQDEYIGIRALKMNQERNK